MRAYAHPPCSGATHWYSIALVTAWLVSGCQRSDAGPQAAEQTFASVCAKCHGRDGKGGVPAAEGMKGPRNFCDATFQAARTDQQLQDVIRNGKGGMPAFGNLFSEQDLKGLVLKVRSFDPVIRSQQAKSQ